MEKLRSRIKLIIFIISGLGLFISFYSYNALASLIGMVVIIVGGQVIHEYIHSATCRVLTGKWGHVKLGLAKGYFYVDEKLTVKDFAIISIMPFVVFELFLAAVWIFVGQLLFGANVVVLMLSVLVGCATDISNVVTQLVYSKAEPLIEIYNPEKHKAS